MIERAVIAGREEGSVFGRAKIIQWNPARQLISSCVIYGSGTLFITGPCSRVMGLCLVDRSSVPGRNLGAFPAVRTDTVQSGWTFLEHLRSSRQRKDAILPLPPNSTPSSIEPGHSPPSVDFTVRMGKLIGIESSPAGTPFFPVRKADRTQLPVLLGNVERNRRFPHGNGFPSSCDFILQRLP